MSATDNMPNFAKDIDAIASKILEGVQPKIDALQAQIDERFDERDVDAAEKLTKQLEETRDEFEKQIQEVTAKFYPPGLDNKEEAPDFNWAKAAKAIATNNWRGAENELEQMETQAKALDSSVDTLGGFVVPAVQSDQLIDRLRADNILFSDGDGGGLGITEIPIDRGFPVKIPRLSSSVTAEWGDDNESITDSDVAFEQLTLTPRSLRALSKIPNQLVENSAPVASQVVQDDIVKQFSNAMDLAGLNGSGNAQPVGVIAEAGNQHAWGGATAVTAGYSNLVGMWLDLAEDNALMGNLGWALDPVTLSHVMQANNETNMEVNRKILSEAPLDRMLGFPYRTSTQLPSGATADVDGNIIFGNWADLLLGRWTSLVLKVSDTAGEAFQRDQTWIRAVMRADFGVRHKNSFCISDNYGS